MHRLFTFEGRLTNPNWGIVAIRVDYVSGHDGYDHFSGMIFVQFANRWMKKVFELFFQDYNRMDLYSYERNLRLVISDATRPISISGRSGTSTGAARKNKECWDCDGPFDEDEDPRLEELNKKLNVVPFPYREG